MSLGTEEGNMIPLEQVEGVIGVQGEQGNDKYYYCCTGCTGITHTVETTNTTNIYNYLCGTGRRDVTGPVGPIWGFIDFPTGICLNASFDHSRVGYQITITNEGITLPFSTNYENNIIPIINAKGSHVQFQIQDSGVYEITYNVYLKEAASVGARIRTNTSVLNSSVINPDSAVTSLAATCLTRARWNDLISLELFSTADVTITLKGVIGASITIKKLAD